MYAVFEKNVFRAAKFRTVSEIPLPAVSSVYYFIPQS